MRWKNKLALATIAISLAPLGLATATATSGVTFEVTRTATGYQATSSTGTTFTGSLKKVTESAVASLGSGGGVLAFGAGEFDFGTEYMELKDIRNIEFRGAGIDATLLKNYSDRARDTEPFNVVGAWDVIVRDMTVSAGGPDRFTSDALDFDLGNRVLVERVRVSDSRGRGIVFDGKGDGWTADDNVIRDCEVLGAPSDGIELLAADRNRVERCRISSVGGHGIQVVKASSNAPQPHKPSSDNVLVGNTVTEVGQDGVQLSGGARNQVLENTVLNAGKATTGHSGIRLMASDGIRTEETVVKGNRATDDQATKTQTYGLDIAGPEVVATRVEANVLDGKVAPLRDRGTGTILVVPADTTPPTAPTDVTATAITSAQVDLSWTGATDDVGVVGYRIYRDGALLTDVGASARSFSDATVSAGTTYSYTLDAVDAAGNRSAQSQPAAVTTTPSSGGTYTLNPVADTYVASDNPTRNYGIATSLRVDAEPVLQSYLRFDVPTMSSQVLSAKLRLYANASSAAGHRVHAVSDTSWDERAVTYATAPPLGDVVGSSGSFSSGRYVEVDVTPLVRSGTALNLGVSGTSVTGISYGSRETVTPPELVVVRGTDTTPPTAPGGLTATAVSGAQVDLTWTVSTDDVGVAGYRVYRDGAGLADLGSTTLSYSDASVSPDTTYTYTVDAVDAAGNRSTASSPATVTTPPASGTLTLLAEADAYVGADAPTRNYGTATSLRLDADPDIRSYLRFAVPSMTSSVVRATLRVYANSNSSAGHRLHVVPDNAWDERSVTYATAPAFGDVVASSGRVTAGTYSDIDVTALVQSGLRLSVAMTGTSTSAISYGSREAANPPLLIVER